MASKEQKKEKPAPKKCVCGREAIIVKSKGKKMVSCPNPLKCSANLRTAWHSNEEKAVEQWNSLF